MPHGSLRIGRVEAVSLCDAVVLASRPATESFPGGTPAAWAQARERAPWAFEAERWRLHVHAFVLRSEGRTVLVDTGIGPETAPAFAWSATRGSLPEELAEAGVDPGDVDTVVITHVHDDHLGWTTLEGAEPRFPNARYLVHPADWSLMEVSSDQEDRATFAWTLAPLRAAGVLELVPDRLALTGELSLEHAPGHTPGHQVVTIDSAGARALVSGDLVNHPVQLAQPGLNGTSDGDPERAAATRAAWLERIRREDRLVLAAHLAGGLGRFVVEGDRRWWSPVVPA